VEEEAVVGGGVGDSGESGGEGGGTGEGGEVLEELGEAVEEDLVGGLGFQRKGSGSEGRVVALEGVAEANGEDAVGDGRRGVGDVGLPEGKEILRVEVEGVVDFVNLTGWSAPRDVGVAGVVRGNGEGVEWEAGERRERIAGNGGNGGWGVDLEGGVLIETRVGLKRGPDWGVQNNGETRAGASLCI